MAWLGIGVGITDLPVYQHSGGGTPTPTPSITAPVLAIPGGYVAGDPLIPNITFDATVSAGMYLTFQMAGNAGFTTPLGPEGAIRTYGPVALTSDDLLNGPVIPILANQPSGDTYERMKITSDEPQDSGWSNTIHAVVVAQVNQFTFGDITNATLSTAYTSNTLTMSGLSGSTQTYSVSGGQVSKNGGAFSSSGGTVVDGDTLRVRVTSSASLSTAVNCTLTVGSVSDTYTVTTTASAAIWSPNTAPAIQNIGYGSNTATFPNEQFHVGTAIVAACTEGRDAAGVTIGGAAATLIDISGAGLDAVSLWRKTITAAGNYDVVVTGSAALKDVSIATGTLESGINGVPTDHANLPTGYGADPQSLSVTIPANGVGLAVVGGAGHGSPADWVAGTSDAGQNSGVNGELSFGLAHHLQGGASGAFNFQANNYGYAGAGMAAAAFGP